VPSWAGLQLCKNRGSVLLEEGYLDGKGREDGGQGVVGDVRFFAPSDEYR